MAKIFTESVSQTLEGNISLQQGFDALVTINQIGDQFYVPKADNLLVRGTVVTTPTGGTRNAGQRFYAVRVIDGVPTEVVELYVGQIVKTDVRGRVVFPGPLASGLRRGDSAFKDVICDHFLEIVGSQMIEDRTWDADAQQYKRDDNNRYVPTTKEALQFEAKVKPVKFDVEACDKLLLAYYQEVYPELFK